MNKKNNNNIKLTIDPNLFSGFADAEGSFVLSITKSNNVSSGWVIKPRFQILSLPSVACGADGGHKKKIYLF